MLTKTQCMYVCMCICIYIYIYIYITIIFRFLFIFYISILKIFKKIFIKTVDILERATLTDILEITFFLNQNMLQIFLR